MAEEGVVRADRAVRAYAYLTASFRAANNVNDVLDCIVPFVADVALKDKTQPVNVAQVAESLANFGLRIPRYAVQQLLPRLQKRGMLEWNALSKSFIPTQKAVEHGSSAVSLDEDFDFIEVAISNYAKSLDLAAAPFSASWSDALIKFLQSESLRSGMKSVVIKSAIVSEFSQVEAFVIARFIQHSYTNDRVTFDAISRVYSGVLIEDFVNNVQSIGNTKDYKGLKVFYDTSVMLRLLGCSGRELETATLEMHNSLIELGCDLHYLETNRTEVSNILDTILNANAYGHEIFGETGEAIMTGEMTIAEIRDLAATFETRLGQLNVFQYDYDYAVRKAEAVFQINELDFTDALVSAAMKRDKSYKRENALNDAKVVGITLRLRRGKAVRELSGSKFIFVSQNSLLQRTARKFCVEHTQEYDDSTIGPVITVGQITTAGWLATERALEPHKVSKELLGNCYSAVRPTANWADEFAKALEQFSLEDKESLEKRADAALILKATRDAVRDQSLNEAAVLRKLNVAEVFRQATVAADRLEADRLRELEDIRLGHLDDVREKLAAKEAEERELREEAIVLAAKEAAQAKQQEINSGRTLRNMERASIIAARLTVIVIVAIIVSLIVLGIADKWSPFSPSSFGDGIVTALALLVAIVGILDLCGLKPVTRVIDHLRRALEARIFKFLEDEQLL
jgi:hypothetical protein